MSKHWVEFVAKKKVAVPVKVKIETKEGEVTFDAHKKIKKPVRVKFKAEDK